MSDTPQRGAPPVHGARRVRCRRTEQLLSVEEHKQCPYCFGELADIEGGDPARFCGFEPGEDPIHFGFPENDPRYRRG
jgi:hypothetical protein